MCLNHRSTYLKLAPGHSPFYFISGIDPAALFFAFGVGMLKLGSCSKSCAHANHHSRKVQP
jgi:hypothetical protein